MCANQPERNEAHDEMLDECYEPYKMGIYTFYASDILYDCDPIAYAQSVSEYEDWQQREAKEEDE